MVHNTMKYESWLVNKRRFLHKLSLTFLVGDCSLLEHLWSTINELVNSLI
jgi:hypothetical protein